MNAFPRRLAVFATAVSIGLLSRAQEYRQCEPGCAASITFSSPNPSVLFTAACGNNGSLPDFGISASISNQTNGTCTNTAGVCGGNCSATFAISYQSVNNCGGLYAQRSLCGSYAPWPGNPLIACPGCGCALFTDALTLSCGQNCASNYDLFDPTTLQSVSVVPVLTCAACP